MNLTSPSQVKAWCMENSFHPNKVLGQNFLIDKNALEAIVDAALAGALAQDNEHALKVLEVGPGLGVLTEGLLQRGCEVTAVEKDPVLADRLFSALGAPEKLTVIKADALEKAKAGELDGFKTMVSNLPYQAGTRILLELIRRIDVDCRSAPDTIVVLVQTEVAERLGAACGSKTRGLAGVWAQLDYDVEIVRTVKACCFWPRPAVGSTIVKLTRHHRNDNLPGEVRAAFRRLTKQAFEHRRKQLGSIFKGIVTSCARAEELTNQEWLDFAAAQA